MERLTRITDVHVHIQPWRELKPKVQEAMRRGKETHWDFLLAIMDDPRALLQILDQAGVWRIGMVNYPSPDVMGFTNATNTFAAKYAEADPQRLLPYGGVDARHTRDPAGDVDRLVDLGIRLCKIHPPHQRYAANAYTEGLDALGRIYRRCEERGLPVMVHTGTSIFPGARSKYGNPMELDDVAIDFPDLRIVMAHGGRPLYMEEAFFILRRHANVWLDVSGIPPGKLLEYFPRLAEVVGRTLWGTDWPSPGVKDLRQNIDQLLGLPLAEDQQRAILETNALAFFPPAR
ncbi:MAG: amidohydrolase [Gemmatimonadetes bacterium]|nr:MAG: amidohydrolase [Gemmatimonadota bacterium]PYO70956.1 MAG: amidohydrolase [Gemmatimonadota bacterium]PYO84926.1 MAG: amidohydrolase [Gemmatimonadota bacterium]